MQSHELEVQHTYDRLNYLGHSKDKQYLTQSNRFYSFATKEGRNARDLKASSTEAESVLTERDQNKVKKKKVNKVRGSYTGPDMIKHS